MDDGYKEGDVLCPSCDSRADLAPVMMINAAVAVGRMHQAVTTAGCAVWNGFYKPATIQIRKLVKWMATYHIADSAMAKKHMGERIVMMLMMRRH